MMNGLEGQLSLGSARNYPQFLTAVPTKVTTLSDFDENVDFPLQQNREMQRT